jgi:hypothetical protein
MVAAAAASVQDFLATKSARMTSQAQCLPILATANFLFWKAVLRIHLIHMFLGLLDPHPDPSVRGMDPDPDLDPSITKQKK